MTSCSRRPEHLSVFIGMVSAIDRNHCPPSIGTAVRLRRNPHFSLSKDLKLTIGAGYQIAVAPDYRASPLTPAYNNNWGFTTRLNF